jgi:adenosylcobinamide-GDP ribazoletransferase
MHEALAFLTVFGGSRTPTSRALRWFPLVGTAIGALLGTIWWLGDEAFPSLLAATLVVLADVAVTGMLHLDGLADAADGLLPHASRARRLEIMRAPDVGAFGVVVVTMVLLTRVAALAGRPPDVALLAAIWCISRTVVAVTPAWLPYVRTEGLASAFVAAPAPRWPALALLPGVGLAVLGIGWPGLVVGVVTLAGALAVVAWSRVRIGGFTGDVLGAAIVVGETVGLVAAAARW